MKRTFALIAAALVVVAAAAAARPQQNQPAVKMSTVAQTPEWAQLQSLAGEWEGFAEIDGKKTPATVEVRVTGDGSALMHVMGRGTPHEMVTMIHPDGKRVLATHYCAAHNQPRMAMTKAPGANQVAFEFVDGTNIAAGDLHMKRLVITFKDASHHVEEWTSVQGGKEYPPAVFSYARKKAVVYEKK